VSLLLDALKRAEQEKLSRQGEASNDAAPAQAPAAQPASAPVKPSLELQPLGGASGTASAPAGLGRGEEPAHAAQVMFDAKMMAQDGKRNRGMLWATLGAIAIVVASAAAYVWYQLRILNPAPTPAIARRPPPLPLPQAASGSSPPPPAPLAESPRAPATLTVAAAEPVTPVAPSPASLPAATAPATQPEDPVTRLLRQAPPAAPAAPLNFSRTIDRPAIPRDVTAGYDALRRGDLAQARQRYEAALAADAASLDARLGMATVEARSGNRSLAVARYRSVLDLDPRNATALAGLAALADGLPPEAVEAQLREDVARFPESAALRFALGAQYAGERRWGEAQAAFYEAYRLDPTSADIAYNLAVSLDHMGQARVAADFYRRAIEAAQAQTTQFDPAAVRNRLAELSGR
jgi:Tfp pilus assembly protein PilF